MDDIMMMYVCPGCKKIFKVKGNNKRVRCNTCDNKYLVDLKMSMEEWAGFEASAKPKYISDVIKSSVNESNTATPPASANISNQSQAQVSQIKGSQPRSSAPTPKVNKPQTPPSTQKAGQAQSAVPQQKISQPSEKPQMIQNDQTQTKKVSVSRATSPEQISRANQEIKQESNQPQASKIKQSQIANEDSSLFDILDLDNGNSEGKESNQKIEPFDIFASLGVDKSDPAITKNVATINSGVSNIVRCRNCGATIEEDQAFCPKCGTPKTVTKKCNRCGAHLQNDQEFCPKCGQKVVPTTDNSISSAIDQFNAKIDKSNKKKKTIPIVIAASVLIILLVIGAIFKLFSVKEIVLSKSSVELKVDDKESIGYTITPERAGGKKVTWSSSNESVAKVTSNGEITAKGAGSCTIKVSAGGKTDTLTVTVKSGPDFKSIYSRYCNSTWASVGSDGSFLSIDTNPSDKDDYTDYDALEAILSVNQALGLPDSLLDSMLSTTAMMGRQTETYSSKGVSVSWSYHPDKGMEISYKSID